MSVSESRARACGRASANFLGERIGDKLIYNIPLRSVVSPVLFMGAYHHAGSHTRHHSAARDVAAGLPLLQLCSSCVEDIKDLLLSAV